MERRRFHVGLCCISCMTAQTATYCTHIPLRPMCHAAVLDDQRLGLRRAGPGYGYVPPHSEHLADTAFRITLI